MKNKTIIERFCVAFTSRLRAAELNKRSICVSCWIFDDDVDITFILLLLFGDTTRKDDDVVLFI